MWKLNHDVDAYVSWLSRDLQSQPLYECKDRVIYFGARLEDLRSEWTPAIDRILELATAEPLATALVAGALHDAERWKWDLHLLRLDWELFHNAGDVVSAVAENLGGSEFQRAVAATELLLRIGPHAGAAVPALRQLLTDNYYLYRLHALQALQSIGPIAEAALGDVVQLLGNGATGAEDKDHRVDNVRSEAAETIGKILPELARSGRGNWTTAP